MASLSSCPHCQRHAKDAFSSNWFPVYTCFKCHAKYCDNDGPPCPECGSNDRGKYDKVYA